MRPIETERLQLREFRQEDIGDVIRWEPGANTQSGKEIAAQRFLDFCFQEYRESGMGPWGILLKDRGLLVGNCGFPHISFRYGIAEVNYYVSPQYRRQGLATEALKTLLRFGFGDVGLAKIQGRCAPDNRSSERVMHKAGMKFERMIKSAASGEASRKEKLFVVTRNGKEHISHDRLVTMHY
jgi:ribosomal-protein-alanine N-acetyltransferase